MKTRSKDSAFPVTAKGASYWESHLNKAFSEGMNDAKDYVQEHSDLGVDLDQKQRAKNALRDANCVLERNHYLWGTFQLGSYSPYLLAESMRQSLELDNSLE